MSRVVLVLSLFAVLALPAGAATSTLVPQGSVWRYLDDGTNAMTSWRETSFDDLAWSSGPAQLGYGDGDEATVVGYGPDPVNKYVTTYFRYAFTVPDPSAYENLTLRVLRDDGAVVYLNGQEVFRTGMNPGAVNYLTLAATAAGGLDETTFFVAYLDADRLETGDNVLAVEVHQSAGASSDVSFDLVLEASDEPTPLEFAWAGALAPTSIRIHAKTKVDTPLVRALVSENPDLTGARASQFVSASFAANNRVASMAVKGLSPGVSYHYAVEVDGEIDRTKQGQFTTPRSGPLTYSFALASCAQTGSSHPVFDTIRSRDPLFFLHMGDMHYQNIGTNDRNLFRAAYDAILAAPAQAALYRSTPIAYIWDDHDYGPNNSDATSPAREAARLTYREYVPHHPLPAGSGDAAIYHAFSVGRVRFVVTDLRSERVPYTSADTPAKTMMSPAQRAWFEQELQAANGVYPVIVWVNTMPWIGTTGDDGWYVYTFDRVDIANFIRDHDIEGLVMLSGDAHMVAIDDGTNSDYATGGGAAIPVFQAASLDQGGSIKGGPYSEGAFPAGGQFGVMTVTDDGVSPVCVSWSGRNSLDAEFTAWSRCAATAPPGDTDGDGVGDVMDCDFADPGVWGSPGPVTGLRVERFLGGSVRLRWASQDSTAGSSTSYDLVAGSLAALRAEGDFGSAACAAEDIVDTPHVHSGVDPPPGEGEYFLLRAVNACGSGGYSHAGPTDPRFALDGDSPCTLP